MYPVKQSYFHRSVFLFLTIMPRPNNEPGCVFVYEDSYICDDNAAAYQICTCGKHVWSSRSRKVLKATAPLARRIRTSSAQKQNKRRPSTCGLVVGYMMSFTVLAACAAYTIASNGFHSSST